MNTYLIWYKDKCCYTDQAIGEAQQELLTASSTEHAEALSLQKGWYIVSIELFA